MNSVIQIILAIGNYLNGATFRGSAFGFKLDILSRLDDSRSSSNHSTSLLHYLAKIIIDTYPNLLGVFDELIPILEAAKSVNLKDLEGEIVGLERDLRKVKEELTTHETTPEIQDDLFVAAFQEFSGEATLRFQSLQLEWNYAREGTVPFLKNLKTNTHFLVNVI